MKNSMKTKMEKWKGKDLVHFSVLKINIRKQ